MKQAMFLLPRSSRDRIYSPEVVAEVRRLVKLTDCSDTAGDLDALRPALADAEIILSGWGMMRMDQDFLDAAGRLEAVLYGAGSVRDLVTDEFWQRNILLTSTYAANAIPVVEYTIAVIVLGTKQSLIASAMTCKERTFKAPEDTQGLYGAKIGIIGAGMVGSGVLEKLKSYDVTTYCCDPFLSEERAQQLGTTKLGLDDVFTTCDVVSLHAASLPSTEHMITGAHLRSMKDGAVFINTARGRIVKEDEMIEVLREGSIFAFIDVTDPEPPAPDSLLYTLPNVFLTPHSAGSGGKEVHRQGEYVLEELKRFLNGDPPRHPVTKEMMEWMA
ncbi:MAG TPA: hydroxyacid dehydrogenase [Armatimonadota bacterium]|nr:hydroxyacid dehydrogenase [Armatimonadota bacterium]